MTTHNLPRIEQQPGQHEDARMAFAADERAHVQHQRDQRGIDQHRASRGWDKLRDADPGTMTDRELAAYEAGDDQVSYLPRPRGAPRGRGAGRATRAPRGPARAARDAADRAHEHQHRDREIARHQDQQAGHDLAAAGVGASPTATSPRSTRTPSREQRRGHPRRVAWVSRVVRRRCGLGR